MLAFECLACVFTCRDAKVRQLTLIRRANGDEGGVHDALLLQKNIQLFNDSLAGLDRNDIALRINLFVFNLRTTIFPLPFLIFCTLPLASSSEIMSDPFASDSGSRFRMSFCVARPPSSLMIFSTVSRSPAVSIGTIVSVVAPSP